MCTTQGPSGIATNLAANEAPDPPRGVRAEPETWGDRPRGAFESVVAKLVRTSDEGVYGRRSKIEENTNLEHFVHKKTTNSVNTQRAKNKNICHPGGEKMSVELKIRPPLESLVFLNTKRLSAEAGLRGPVPPPLLHRAHMTYGGGERGAGLKNSQLARRFCCFSWHPRGIVFDKDSLRRGSRTEDLSRRRTSPSRGRRRAHGPGRGGEGVTHPIPVAATPWCLT